MSTSTLQNFGVPLGGGTGRGGLLQPKAKHKFRVRVINFGPVAGGIELSQQVVSVGRPTHSMEPVTIHSYNSTAYYGGKMTWNPISLTVRDDVTNAASRLVGYQQQKQMNVYSQTSPLAGSDYKFQAYIETLDGGDTNVLETWFLEGCFLESVEYDTFEYSSAEAMVMTMSIRFDNATQQGGLMPLTPDLGDGVLV